MPEDQDGAGSRVTFEGFLRIAEVAGLDTSDDKHMDELYRFVLAAVPGRDAFGKLDLTGIEPASVFSLVEE